jgi:nucleotide-binding universal stress UspA family protein
MIKTVLVHLTGAETDEVALQTALQIARPFGGHLNCLHTRLDSDARVAAASSVAMASAIAIAETVSVLKRQDVQLTGHARRSFDKFCDRENIVSSEKPNAGANVTAVWVEKPGTDFEQIISFGRLNDLLVLSRKFETYIGLPPAELGDVLLDVGRPVIVVSPQPLQHFPKKVGIAWKDTAEAARALSAAMPVIAKADHAIVFTVNEDSEHANECIDCMEGIADNLRWHGPAVEVQYLVPGGRHLPETILQAAYESGVDLLVAGAYGHSRLRELIFGGFTQRILDGVNVPVLMFH